MRYPLSLKQHEATRGFERSLGFVAPRRRNGARVAARWSWRGLAGPSGTAQRKGRRSGWSHAHGEAKPVQSGPESSRARRACRSQAAVSEYRTGYWIPLVRRVESNERCPAQHDAMQPEHGCWLLRRWPAIGQPLDAMPGEAGSKVAWGSRVGGWLAAVGRGCVPPRSRRVRVM